MEWTYSELIQKARPFLEFEGEVQLSPKLFQQNPLFRAIDPVYVHGDLEFNSGDRWTKVRFHVSSTLHMLHSITGEPVDLHLESDAEIEYTFNREADHDEQIIADKLIIELDEQIAIAILLDVPLQIFHEGEIPDTKGIIPW